MKTATLLFAIVIFLSFIQAEGWAQEKANEPLFGTWVNQDYSKGYYFWRFVYQTDGSVLYWAHGKPRDQPYNAEGRFSIEKEWRDSEGSVWYRIAERWCFPPFSEEKAQRRYGLAQIAPSGDVLEGEWSTVDFPSQFGALGGKHYVYHRE